MIKISIIIPTCNEQQIVKKQLQKLMGTSIIDDDTEIILVDSGEDKTAEIASQFDVKIIKSKKGRAIQMNKGAKSSEGKILYFLHIDTDVPNNFLAIIRNQINLKNRVGCFQMLFDDPHWLMKFYGWMTRFPLMVCRGGDQSLFITKELFSKIKGFDETLIIMEDIDIIKRIKKETKFHILKEKVITSARKYKMNGRVRLQLIFGLIHLMHSLGVSKEKIIKLYTSKVR